MCQGPGRALAGKVVEICGPECREFSSENETSHQTALATVSKLQSYNVQDAIKNSVTFGAVNYEFTCLWYISYTVVGRQ